MDIIGLFKKTTELNVSDLHITVGVPPVIRVNGSLQKIDECFML